MCNLHVKGKGPSGAYNSGMDTELRNKEREAWDEVLRRLDFFIEAYSALDVSTTQMAADKFGEAVGKHSPLYAKRMDGEFGTVEKEES